MEWPVRVESAILSQVNEGLTIAECGPWLSLVLARPTKGTLLRNAARRDT